MEEKRKEIEKCWQARFYEEKPLTSMIVTGVIVGIITLIIGSWINMPTSQSNPKTGGKSMAYTDDQHAAGGSTDDEENADEGQNQEQQSWLQKIIYDETVQKRAEIYSKAQREHPFIYYIAAVTAIVIITVGAVIPLIFQVIKARNIRLVLLMLAVALGTAGIIWAGYDLMMKGQDFVG